MKTLYILRHGKADRPTGLFADHERPLLPRGREEVAHMCHKLVKKGMNPEMILSSTAVRARQTAETAARELGHALETIRTSESIYGAEADELGLLLRQQDDSCRTLMLVGHNPGLEELAEMLAPGYSAHLPTGGIIILNLAITTWAEIRPGCGTLLRTFFP